MGNCLGRSKPRQTAILNSSLNRGDGHNISASNDQTDHSNAGVRAQIAAGSHSASHSDTSSTRPMRQELRIVIDGNLSSPIIDTLVLQTLAIIRTLVDNEQPPPEAMMQLHKIADNETGWLAIVHSMINKITTTDPLGPAVITLILDECPLPSKNTILKLTRHILVSPQSAKLGRKRPMRERNICILYGFLAEKLAGLLSSTLLTTDVLLYLIENLAIDKEPYVILHAILALEKFALTSENKSAVINALNGMNEGNPLIKLEEWRYSSADKIQREVGFCSEWTLDNLFVPKGRVYTYEHVDNSNLNAMLNCNDTSEYLKISTNGLEARSDALSFESVRCTYPIDDGSWYYEVQLVTNGVLQIGWATKDSKFLNYDGYGIGDDEYSLAYDGCRQLIWYNAHSKKHTQECWKPGDVLGCYLNVRDKLAIFSLNGEELPSHSEIFSKSTKGFFAAASFMTFQQCIFNFGTEPFKYPPSRPYETFNEWGELDEKFRQVLPRHKRLEILRRLSVKEDGCQLCFDNHATVTLKPCGHSGFCSQCAAQLDRCPLDRSTIESMEVHKRAASATPTTVTSNPRSHLHHNDLSSSNTSSEDSNSNQPDDGLPTIV